MLNIILNKKIEGLLLIFVVLKLKRMVTPIYTFVSGALVGFWIDVR